MRPATKKERESVNLYIESISHKSGIMYTAGDVDYKEDFEIDFFGEHPKADMSNVDKVRINEKVYLAADKILEIIRELEQENQLMPTWYSIYKYACKDFRAAVLGLKGGAK